MFENLLEIPNLVDVKMLFIIPFHPHAQKEMQVYKIFHFELSTKLFLYLHKLVLIVACQDEIIDIDNNEKLDIAHDLCNIHAKINITPYKLDFFQKCI
jgi:hypothetical protein